MKQNPYPDQYDFLGGNSALSKEDEDSKSYEYQHKDARVTMRIPRSLLLSVKREAAVMGIPYQRYIRLAIEEALRANHDDPSL